MAFKQPRVPEYREREGADRYIRSLVLFLKDFCMDVWTANNQRSGEISDAVKGYPVTSVCGKKGDVKLSASDVGALEQNGTAVNASKLGGKAPEYYIQPRNLLDNSDFRNPVNQRGQTSYIGSDQGQHTIDRWKIWNNETLNVNDGYIGISGRAYQYYPLNTFKNTVHTFAAKKFDGTIITTTFNPNQESTQDIYGNLLGSDGWSTIIGLTNGQYVWAALYEGSYTADTLPPYVPKGYAAELAECRRYYKRFTSPNSSIICAGYVTASKKCIYINALDNYPMRIDKPSCSFSGNITVRGIDGYIAQDYSDVVTRVYANATGCISMIEIARGDSAEWNATNNTPLFVTINANSVFELIADL